MEFNERLKWARAQRFSEAKLAAEAIGVPVGTYGNHEAGSRQPKLPEIERYAKAFRVSKMWLAYGEGSPEETNTVGVVGTIAAGGTIESSSEQLPEAEPLYEIEVPFPVPNDAFALQVKGDSMWPRYDDGDVIVCHRYSQDPLPLVGWEAAVGTPDGNRYLKRLMRGSEEGRYTLESHNAAPIRDVALSWASEVFGVVRAARWRQLDDKSRRRELRKAIA